MATETLEIVFLDEGMAFGSSVIFSLTGGTSIEKCKFVARVSSLNGTYDLGSINFRQPYYGRDSVGAQSEQAVEALNQFRREIESRGWRQVGKGSAWYSYQYRRS